MTLVLLGIASGCGGDDESAGATVAEPTDAVTLAAARLREEGTFRFEVSFTRVKETEPDDVEEYATAEGAVDLGAGRSRASLELAPLFPGRENDAPLDKPVELRWNTKSVTVVVEGRSQRIARARARESGGLFGRYPDEVDALHGLLADAKRPRLLESEGGETHYAFEIDSRRAGRRGFPAELNKLFAQGRDSPKLELETWIREDGLPSRLDYIVRLEPVRNAGKLVLPARTIRVTYELSAFAEPVELDG